MLQTIRPLTVGNLTFPNNLIQAPLAGFSCAPFRRITRKYGNPAFSCTEMISCKSLLYQPKSVQLRYILKDPEEGPVCFQLFGNDPQDLAEATKIITDHGADLIDLNCGCSVRKVRSQGAGSILLTDPPKLYKMICAMRQSTHLPISIKIRVDGASQDNLNAEIAKVVNDSELDFLVVHGRRWSEHYNTPCRYDQIQYFVETVKIPVIGNGDVACAKSLQKMFATGCAGAMIGRAGIGQPWLIRKLCAELTQQPFAMPTPTAIGAIFIEQITLLQQLLNHEKLAILQARKLAHAYSRNIPRRSEFCIAANTCDNLAELQQLCSEFFVN